MSQDALQSQTNRDDWLPYLKCCPKSLFCFVFNFELVAKILKSGDFTEESQRVFWLPFKKCNLWHHWTLFHGNSGQELSNHCPIRQAVLFPGSHGPCRSELIAQSEAERQPVITAWGLLFFYGKVEPEMFPISTSLSKETKMDDLPTGANTF